MGGGGGAQSNFPIRDHQNIFNLILTYILYKIFLENIWGARPPAPMGATAMHQLVYFNPYVVGLCTPKQLYNYYF